MTILLRDIAKLAGVSVATAHKVIKNQPGVNIKVRQRVLQIVGEHNYPMAKFKTSLLEQPYSDPILLDPAGSDKHRDLGRLGVESLSSAAPLPVPVNSLDARFPVSDGVQTAGAWQLVWQDEFNGDEIDLSKWTFNLGGGWGNGEDQYYTDRPENVRLENGCLLIEARREDIEGYRFTSARMKTQGLHAWTYSRIEARIRIPSGQGIWPAFWMLGSNIISTGWPNCGEIDIMEHVGKEPFHIHHALHGPGYSGGENVGGSVRLAAPPSAAFHVYAIEWEADEIRWYLDGELIDTIRAESVPGEWVYDHDFFILLNVAVGGYWPGAADETTVFPQQMLVDYVRVYQAAPPKAQYNP